VKRRALKVLPATQPLQAPVRAHLHLVTPASASEVVLREALPTDVEELHTLLGGFAAQGLLLPRTVEEVYRNFREFVVAEHNGRIVGCAGLRLYSSNLGEIVGLAVSEESHGRGVGRLMVDTLLAQAKSLGLHKVIALTLKPEFFTKLGFEAADVADYPQKIAADCSRCAKRATCVEHAVAYDLN
jgi:amino-acid N-acetyltransferase